MSISGNISDQILSVANKYGELLVERLREKLIEGNGRGPKLATGSLIGEMKHSVRQDDQGRTVIELISEDYLRYVDRGRRPGKFPPLEAIKQWTRVKLIPERAAFPIARKIATEGIKPMNIINPTITEVELEFLPEYEKEMEQILGVVLINDVFSNTNTKGRILPKSLR